MIITPIAGERMCYEVVGDSGHKYRVDMLANNGLSHCQCVNWGVVRWANVKIGIRDNCKHIDAVRTHIKEELSSDKHLNDLLERIAKEYE
jgi:hypothetical protein